MYDIELINWGLIHTLWGCKRHGYGFLVMDYILVNGAGTLAASAVTSLFPKMRQILVQLLIAQRLIMKAMQAQGAGPVLDSNKSAFSENNL